MTNIKNLSRLMKMSWDIQRRRRNTRAQALTAAWAIFSNEDITVLYLAVTLNHRRPLKPQALNQISLFNSVNP